MTGSRPRWRGPVWWVLGGLFVAALVALFWPLLVRPYEPVPHRQCLADVKNLAIALNMYLYDYDALPNPERWCDRTMEYVKSEEVYRCPQAPDLRCGYALNTGAEGASYADAASGASGAGVVAIFESDAGWNAHGGRKLLPEKPRYMGGDCYGFLDGHAKWFERGGAEKLRWELGAQNRE